MRQIESYSILEVARAQLGEAFRRMPRPTTVFIVLIAFISLGCAKTVIETGEHELGDATSAELGETSTAAEPSLSHQRMLDELEQIRAHMAEHHPFLGRGRLKALRAQLEQLPADAPVVTRWTLLRSLGSAEVWLGEMDVALAHLHASYELLPEVRRSEHVQDIHAIVFELGLAYLRLGENTNCLHCEDGAACLLPIRPSGVHTDKEGSRGAVKYFTEALRLQPNHLPSVWLLNIAAMTLGEHPSAVPARWRISETLFASRTKFPVFANVAPKLGLDVLDLSGGALVDDFNNDGFLDVFTSTWDTAGSLHYFTNEGNGKFVERTKEAGLVGIYGGLNLIQADYDNDGDLDVYVMRGAWLDEFGRHPNSLLCNNGDNTFTDATFAVGLGDARYPGQTADWADYDNDGDLDLYVGTESKPGFDWPSKLFRNKGDGTFEDVTDRAGVSNKRFAKAVIFGDYNGDRFPDIYVSNLRGDNRLYRNNGDGTFTDVAVSLNVTGPKRSFPAWYWDFDNDGALDIFVSSYWPHVQFVAASYVGEASPAELPRLYRGDGRGGFTDVAKSTGLDRVTLPMGSNFGDLDNDGFLDFYLGTGYPEIEGVMPNVMYWNRGGRRFEDVSAAGGFGHLQKGHGVAFADIDHDGDQDVFMQMGGAYPVDRFSNALFENPGFKNNWVALRLVGTKSNRCAIGVRIKLTITEDGQTRTIYRWVGTGGSFGGNPLRQHIGIGKATFVDEIEIFWPTSQLTQAFQRIAANQLIEVTEGINEYREVAYPLFYLGS